MADEVSKSGIGDLLGIKPIAKAVEKATGAAIDGVSSFLSRICLPVAEEYGLLLRDKVSHWRAMNALETTKKAKQKMMELNVPEGIHAHPRIAHAIMEQGSWTDDSDIQDLWAGLLSSSCTEKGDDDSNLLFVNLLSDLTKLQARVLKYACEKSGKSKDPAELIVPHELRISLEELIDVAGDEDIQRLDRELDHLRESGLIYGGLEAHSRANILLTPSALALHMYVRCSGSRESPLDFFKLN